MFSLLLFVISVKSRLGCIILLWQTLDLLYNCFDAEGGIWVLTAQVADHCLLIAFYHVNEQRTSITNIFGETVASFCEKPYTRSDVFCYHASSYVDNNKHSIVLFLF